MLTEAVLKTALPDSSSVATVRCTDEAVAIQSILRSGYSGLKVGGSRKTHLSALSSRIHAEPLGQTDFVFPYQRP